MKKWQNEERKTKFVNKFRKNEEIKERMRGCSFSLFVLCGYIEAGSGSTKYYRLLFSKYFFIVIYATELL